MTAGAKANIGTTRGGSGGAPTGPAGGDLTGTYPNPTLAAAGTAGTYGSSILIPVITTDSKGRVTSVTQVTPTSDAPSGPAGGDLTGTYPNPTLATIPYLLAYASANLTILAGMTGNMVYNTVTTQLGGASAPTLSGGSVVINKNGIYRVNAITNMPANAGLFVAATTGAGGRNVGWSTNNTIFGAVINNSVDISLVSGNTVGMLYLATVNSTIVGGSTQTITVTYIGPN